MPTSKLSQIIDLENRSIRSDQRPFVIAEVTTNHRKEIVNKAIGKQSSLAPKDLTIGTVVTQDNMRFIRSGAGILANIVYGVQGKRLTHAVLQ